MGRGGGGRERLLGKCFLLQRSPLCARKKYLKCAPRVYFISLVGRGYMMENFSARFSKHRGCSIFENNFKFGTNKKMNNLCYV